MADNVDLIINQTFDNVVINPSITTEVVDINVSATNTSVDIIVNPNLTIVNINELTGGGGGGLQGLQSVTDYGAITTTPTSFTSTDPDFLDVKSLYASTDNGFGIYAIATAADGKPIYAQSTSQSAVKGVSTFDGTGVEGHNTATGEDVGVGVSGSAIDGIAIAGTSTNGIGGSFSSTTGTAIRGSVGNSANGLLLYSSASSTGNPIEIVKDTTTKYTLNQQGEQSIVKIPSGTSSQFLMADGTTYSLNNINSKQLQLNYLDSDNAIFDAFYLRVLSDNGTFESSNQLLSSLALLRSISYVAQGYIQQLNADKFVKLGGTSGQYLMADGSTSIGSGSGANLTTSQTSTNFTINSDTGTDASVPLGNGTLAGASLNDYTSAEKTKLSGIAAGAEVNVNADWNATSGDAQILNKPTISGIQSAIASGTDTYTATISGVSSYVDGAAYLIRFTNGNTTGCTLNINSLGAVTLYTNNDGVLIGGDIESGGEMLCIYNSTLTAFQCIGTSPNSLISYVTNADSVTITKGMPVYAFGGTGDRMTVKRAYNTLDATSAQTVGLVMSTSIAVNQKGIIMMQGLLDGLSILPTSTFADGDTIYLGETAGTITNVKPYAPNHLVYLGVVTTSSNGAAGRMYVRVQNGYELAEIHDVQLTNPVPDNHGLFYDELSSLWMNKSILTILGYTPANNANVVQSNTAITGATNAKITYDSKGLVTAGTTLIASDIPNIAQSQVTSLTTDLGLKQDKSLSAYSMIANNTASTANTTEFTFRRWNQATYSGSLSWAQTAPTTILGASYSGQQVGNMVSINISVVYSTAGTGNLQVTLPLPSDFPTPLSPTGFTSALDVLAYGTGQIMANTSQTVATGARGCFLRRNTSNNGYEFFLNVSVATAAKVVMLNLTYQTS